MLCQVMSQKYRTSTQIAQYASSNCSQLFPDGMHIGLLLFRNPYHELCVQLLHFQSVTKFQATKFSFVTPRFFFIRKQSKSCCNYLIQLVFTQ